MVQPVSHRPHVGDEFTGDLAQRPGPLGDPVDQIILQGGKAELGRLSGQALVGAATPMRGGQHRLGWALDPLLGQQVADDRGGGAKLAGHAGQGGVVLASDPQVAGKLNKPLRAGLLVQAALLGVEDREAAPERQLARRWRRWSRYTCARATGPHHSGTPASMN